MHSFKAFDRRGASKGFENFKARTGISSSLHDFLESNPGIPNLSLTMYPFSISTDAHVPLIFLSMAWIDFSQILYFIMTNHMIPFYRLIIYIYLFNNQHMIIFESSIH